MDVQDHAAKKEKSVRQVRFEKDTDPYVEGLWRTALWLTKRWSLAEQLVLKTMTEAYRSWSESDETIDSKARLFRILSREFMEAGYPKDRRDWYLPEESAATADNGNGNGNGNGQRAHVSIDERELLILTKIPDVSIRGVIARLRPESRLIIILKMHEEFSYADIAFITDLRRDSVRSILQRLRRLIPQYVLHKSTCLTGVANDHPSTAVREPSSEDNQPRG